MNLWNVDNLGNTASALWKHVKDYFWTADTEKGLIDYHLSIIGEETLSADCDVTDHYVESNNAYQDQIALKPKVFTIQGEVGELVWYQRDPVQQGLGQLAQRLEGVISFLPLRSKSFNQMKSKVMRAAQWVDTASNVLSKINTLSSTQGNAQTQAYENLVAIRDNRYPVSIQTPWGIGVSYVITNLKFTQPKETKDKTFISITFKEFRTTHIEAVPFDSAKYQGNAVYENQPKVDNGNTTGADASIPKETVVEDAPRAEIEKCSVFADDDVQYSLTFDDKTKEISVFNTSDGEAVSAGSPSYYLAIDAGRAQCETEISHWQNLGLELDK